jgi:hypothetical protein
MTCQISTSSVSGSIAVPLLVHTHTSKANQVITIRAMVRGILGGGPYTAYIQHGPMNYEMQPRQANTIPAGVMAISFYFTNLPVLATGVTKVYVVGRAGDTTNPAITTEVYNVDPQAILQDTAEGGGASTITLAVATAPAVSQALVGSKVRIIAGAGMYQSRIIVAYDASTRIASLSAPWVVAVDNTSVYEIYSAFEALVDSSLQMVANVPALANVQSGVNAIQADYARRSGDYATPGAQIIIPPADMALNSTVMKAAEYTAPDNISIAVIKAKTDNLPASPAAVGSAMTLTNDYDAAKSEAPASDVTSIKLKTDQLAFTVPTQVDANAVGGLTKADIRDALGVAEANLDDQIGGIRLSYTSYISEGLGTSAALIRKRGDRWTISITDLGSLVGYSSIWFTLKANDNQSDSEAILMIRKNANETGDGLLYLNGVPGITGLGEEKIDISDSAYISVNDEAGGNLSIVVKELANSQIAPGIYTMDIQTSIAGFVSTPSSGTFTVTRDTTRAIA